jgi:hypothetical protein
LYVLIGFQVIEIMSTFAEASKASHPVGMIRSASVSKSPAPIDSSDAISFEVRLQSSCSLSSHKLLFAFLGFVLGQIAHVLQEGSHDIH